MDDPLCLRNIDGKVLTDSEICRILIPDKVGPLGNEEEEGEVDEEEEVGIENTLRGL